MKLKNLRCLALLSSAALLFTACGTAKNTENSTPSPTDAASQSDAANPSISDPAQSDVTTSPATDPAQSDPANPPAPTLTPAPTPIQIYGAAGEIAAYNPDTSNYQLSINAAEQVHEISDLLYGIFIEDINFAADGGLYAEMVQNRSFEFTRLASGNEFHAWSKVGQIDASVTTGDALKCRIVEDGAMYDASVTTGDAQGGLNQNNTNYLVMENSSTFYTGVANRGFLDGMSIVEGADYRFSIYAKGLDGFTGPIQINIMAGSETAASAAIPAITGEWKKYELTLSSSITAYSGVALQVMIPFGKCAVDMVSLFPADTYNRRENGLRADLAEKLEALQPAFLRFPGGCVIEGVTLDAAYDWKDSIGVDENRNPLLFNGTYGDVAARKQGQNIWTNEALTNDPYPSFMSYGLGFYEYFLLAEDIGAVGVPVINCGLCCMGQANGAGPAVSTTEFERYIDDALDLVEFCRGDASTVWGAVRTAMGHKEPFPLKYVGIGNEQWGKDFFEHYKAFVDAFAKAREEKPEIYGDIELMFSAGIDDGDSGYSQYIAAYQEASDWLAKHPDRSITDFAGAIDHHYYNPPEWFFSHTDYYDEANYSRSTSDMTDSRFGGGIQVFLGEYAAQSNTLKAALSEAAYMTGLERNGDIVRMAAYAPLFGNLTATHWAPDLIWFNNHESTASINYYMQQVFAKNAGAILLSSSLEGAQISSKNLGGKIGVGTWNTAACYDDILVIDNETGTVLASQDFENGSIDEWEKVSDGKWGILDGALVQTGTSTNTALFGSTGSALYYGDNSWTNYTYTLKATKTNGSEGFLIPFCVGDKNNNYFWNIGGWNNTVSCLQQVENGNKSGQLGATVKNFSVKINQTYELKLVITNWNVKCYIDNELYIDYTIPESTNAEAYHVVSTDETGDIIIKLVNVTGYEKTFAIDLSGAAITSDTADCDVVAGTSLANDNILGRTPVVALKSETVSGISEQFNYTVPQYSVTVLRIKTK